MENETKIIDDYLKKRLIEAGLTKEQITITAEQEEGRFNKIQLLSPNYKQDAININYVCPSGKVLTYLDNKKEKPFSRVRYRVPKIIKDKEGKEKEIKYFQPKESEVFSFCTPGIIDKYKNNEHFKSLIVVEGEIKALSGYVNGLDIIAIGGIHNYRNTELNTIEPFIERIIEKNTPENIVLLFDSDSLAIKYEAEKDLANRLNLFYTAVVKFRELLKPFPVDVYFAYISEKYIPVAKGLDDLLNLKGVDKKAVIKELENLNVGEQEYFNITLLRGGFTDKLEKLFCLDSQFTFYEKYKSIIQDKEFKYKKNNYYFDGNTVVNAYYNQALSYLRIGCDFYKKILRINPHKDLQHQKPEVVIEKWQIGEINRDFNNNKKFITMIPKYDCYINVPDNSEKYQRIIEKEFESIISRQYNRYNQLSHDFIPGEWKTIERLLKHIFSAKNTSGEVLYNFGLDYLQLLFFEPKKRLPVLCFVSNERNTGKTKFLEFLRLIFRENMAIVDNERFTGKFTSHFVDKLVVAIDEGFIPMEQKLMKERIKNFTTSSTVWCEGKGKDAFELDNFIKLIMCSNDESNFMQIDEGENRFAVFKVPVLDIDIPNIVELCEKEVPHFLDFLKNRKLFYETGQSRFSFSTKVYETQALKDVMSRTEKRLSKEIREFLRSQFISHEQKILYYSPTDLTNEINNSGARFKIDKSDVNDFLKYDVRRLPEKKMWYCIYETITELDRLNEPTEVSKLKLKKTGTPYAFLIEDYFTKEELEDLDHKDLKKEIEKPAPTPEQLEMSIN